MEDVYLLLGANLSEREAQIAKARELIAREIGPLTGQSGLYESESWGGVGEQPDYLNQVVRLASALDPLEILGIIQRIEELLGRVRTLRWGARVIDIDILFFGKQLVDLPQLQIPHPRFQERNFAMIPMNELAPDFIHPRLNVQVSTLLEVSADRLGVRAYNGSTD